MQKFFEPSSWEKNSKAIEFKSVHIEPMTKEVGRCETETTKKKQKLVPPNKESTTGRIVKRRDGKKHQLQKLTPSLAKVLTTQASQDAAAVTTTSNTQGFKAKLKEELMGGRFRYLNEQLYTMHSKNAEALFREDRDAFNAYHDGYRHQVEKWPMNPLKRIINTIRRLPKTLQIGDFGCGEGKLAQAVPNKVYSMDLVSCRSDIIACDMANTPLASLALDVAVYCLSLMGTNQSDYFLEANRVLKTGGLLLIAEIQSRFDNVQQFVSALEAHGFELMKKDTDVKLFYFFQFRKARNVSVSKVSVLPLPKFTLKPCLYRKR